MWKAVHVSAGGIYGTSLCFLVILYKQINTNTYRSYLFCDPKRCVVEDCRINSPSWSFIKHLQR